MTETSKLQTILRNRKRHHPVPEVSVGRRAELHVEAMLAARCRDSSWEYFSGLRVPHRGRRREIDFVVTTGDELWVVELKNWSGFVGIDDGGNVVQHRSGGRGVVDHGPLLRDMQTRRRAVRNVIGRDVDDMPEIRAMLVFYDRRVGLDDRLAAVDELEVMRLPEFLSMLPASSDSRGLLSRISGGLFGGGDTSAIPDATEPVRRAREQLGELGTWDLLVLHGGQIVSGDLVAASVDELCDRERFQQFRLQVPRGLLDVFRSELEIRITAIERSGDRAQICCGFDESIRFHCAGDPKPKTFELRDVEGMVVSR